MKRVFGLETEYGITLDGTDSVDVVAESIELVRGYTEQGAHMKWDYELEDPHCDARGFRAAELLQDTDESAYFEIDRKRPLSFEEIKSDLVLSNGARFYNDHAHPEYSTPECTTLRGLVAQDKAGERILVECARRRNLKLPNGQEVRLYKNNTDFSGHSYGCHDNYLMRRDVPWERIVAGVLPFLVTPHADARSYRRFHVIVGDANMSEWATALKVGTTALVLDLIERDLAPQIELAQPVAALKLISRDQTYDWIIELRDGRKISALEVQRLYLTAVQQVTRDADEEMTWLLREWEAVLNDLERDVMLCRDRVDWVAKKELLTSLRKEEKLAWSDPWLQAIDLEYHNLRPDAGLYHELVRQGSMRRLVTEEEIKQAIFAPPEETRAYFRGRAVARFDAQIKSIQWDEVVFADGTGRQTVAIPEPTDNARLKKLSAAVRDAPSYPEFLRIVAAL